MNTLMRCLSAMALAVLMRPAAALDIDNNPNAVMTAARESVVVVATGARVVQAFAVRVVDSAGDPKTGIRVSFAGTQFPDSVFDSAYGSFAGSVGPVEVRTDARGLATAPAFTAGSGVVSYQVTATVDPGSDPQTRALLGDGEIVTHFDIFQYEQVPAVAYVVAAPTVEQRDVPIAAGSYADVTVTISNTTVSLSPELSLQLRPAYHYELLAADGCGPLTPEFTDTTILRSAFAPIAAGGERSCTFRVSRDATDADSSSATWTLFPPTSDGAYQSLSMRFGSFSNLALGTTLVSRAVDRSGVRSIVRVTARNDGTQAVTPVTSLNRCPTGVIQSVLSGACTLIPPACVIGLGENTPVLAWPSIAPGETAQCEIGSTIALANAIGPIGMRVAGVTDTATGGDLYASAGTDAYLILPLDLAVDVNQYGLSGSWASPEASAQGLVLNVVPDFYDTGHALLFGGWFTYDVTPDGGQRWYTLQGRVDGSQADVAIYRTEGGALDTSQATTTAQVGTARLSFSDCSYGQMFYSFDDGRYGLVPLVRLLPNVSCANAGEAVPAPGADYALTGTWADSSANGQGFVIDIDPQQHTLFGGWFTFVHAGVPTASTGQRWFTLQGDLGPAAAQGSGIPIYDSNGGVFDQAASTSTVAVGSVDIAMQSCSTATFTYRFTSGENAGRVGTMELTRLGAPPPSCMR